MFEPSDKIILKGIGGFYYVKSADVVLEARAKGIFRRMRITPLAGDIVEIEESVGDYVISEIHERKNFFLRPPAANVDVLFLTVSSVDPYPNLMVIDKLTAIAAKKGIRPAILLTKTDIMRDDCFVEKYIKAGFDVIDVRRDFEGACKKIKEIMRGSFSLFSGNSGVGKSTLLNDLFEGLDLETGETSKKLGRGRHTTRMVEIYEREGLYFADTPGFSAVDIERSEYIAKDELQSLFIEIEPFSGKCRFAGCSHISEPGCLVTEALSRNEIVMSRYESYRDLYKRAEKLNDWDLDTERK